MSKKEKLPSYEDAEMPEYNENDGKWYDNEYGWEIAPPEGGTYAEMKARLGG